MKKNGTWLWILGVVAASWYGMETVHESGHALAGWASGGHVVAVSIPLWGFSRTEVDPNPHACLETWAGPLLGALLPLLVLGLLRGWLRPRPRRRWTALYFTGFCLIANGAYLAFGWLDRAGDTGELLRLGVRPWQLVVAGFPMLAGGLACWHRLGPRFGAGAFLSRR